MKRMTPTLIFFCSGLLVHAGNYAVQILLGRSLGPVGFSDFSAVFTIWLLIEVLTLSVQAAAVSLAAEREATDESAQAVTSELLPVASRIAPALSILLLILSPYLSETLNLTCGPAPLVIVSLCLPFSIRFAIERGVLQGQDRLVDFSKSYLVEVVFRLASTAIAILVGGTVTLALAALLLTVWATHRYTLAGATPVQAGKLSKTGQKLAIQTGLTLLTLQSLSVTDLLTLKSTASETEAGYYAGFFLLGKVILLASSPLYALLLSRPAQARAQGKSAFQQLFKLGGAALVLSGITALIFSVFPQLALLFLGDDYAPGLPILQPIVWSALALVAIFCLLHYALALRNNTVVLIGLVGGFIQPLSLLNQTDSLADSCWSLFFFRTILIGILVLTMATALPKKS